ncbi:MAG: YdcF family protein [Alphaproteobacteria bacterium]|nr:YdcF family protein [Alphaproteobacteria bacterium]MBQ8631477.1 YdcF family protein [Alphaproteobacteria bacterium]
MRKLFIIAVLFLLSAWFAGFLWFNHQINSYENTAGIKTDAIIALTGGRNRISNAVALLNDGAAEKLFISGVSKQTSLTQIEQLNDLRIRQKQKVQTGSEAKDTIGNAIEADEWIKKNNVRSIRLVTSNYHLPRSILEFRHRSPEVSIVPSPVYSDKVQAKWWKNPGSFRLIATEYNKFLYVYFSKKFFTGED